MTADPTVASRPRTGPRSLLVSLLVGCVALTAAVATSRSVARFHDASDMSLKLDSVIMELEGLGWAYSGVTDALLFGAPPQRMVEAITEIGRIVEERRLKLTTLHADDSIVGHYGSLVALGTLAHEAGEAAVAGDLGHAAQIRREQMEPSFEAYLDSSRQIRGVLAAKAESSAARADTQSTLALIGLALIVVLLAAVLLRSKRNQAVRAGREQALRESEQRFRALVQKAPDMITVLDTERRIIYESPAVERLFGWRLEERIGNRVPIHPDDEPRVGDAFARLIATPGASDTVELRMRDASGAWHWIESTGTNLLNEPAIQGFVCNYRIIDDRKAMEQRLTKQAYHDPLTGLANRALFRDRLTHALQARSTGTLRAALLFFDLDDFKTVNDALGHQVGDELLSMVGRRIESCIRPEDTVGRLGGDEYAILVERPESEEVAIEVATRIIEAMKAPFRLAEMELFAHGSIGIAFDRGDHNVETLFRSADIAMYVAKARGKGSYEVFDGDMDDRLRQRIDVKNGLSTAVASGELILHYQPIIALDSGNFTGVEALLRWEHPSRGLLPPSEFIALAEESGVITEIGAWVIREACAQLGRWRAEYPELSEISMSINVSGQQLIDGSLVEVVGSALADASLPGTSLVLEVTETALVKDPQAASRTLRGLKELGVAIAIDDFGTGYSSLSRLRELPIDIVKIDRTFVTGVASGPEDSAVARAMIKMGHAFGLHIVAEGVETEAQAAELRTLECDLAQGYYFGRPAEPSALSRSLTDAVVTEGLLKDIMRTETPSGSLGS